MKLAVDAREFTESKTGIARYLENLLAPLVSSDDIRMILFVNRESCVPRSIKGPSVKLIALPALPTPLVDQFVIPYQATRAGARVFFSPYYKTAMLGSFKRVTTVHDIMFLRLPGERPALRSLRSMLFNIFVKRADILLCDSQFTKHDISSLLPSLADRSSVLYPGLHASWRSPPDDSDDVVARYTKTGRYLLYVGNFKPHKNVDMLVRAFSKSLRNGKAADHELLLAGSDSRNVGRIRGLIAALGIGERVLVHEDVVDHDLRSLYARAAWYVSASAYEGFGYPFLEAMVSGCPVVCYPCTSIQEVTGGAAVEIRELSVDSVAAALERAMAYDDAARNQFVAAGRSQADRFVPGNGHKEFLDAVYSLA